MCNFKFSSSCIDESKKKQVNLILIIYSTSLNLSKLWPFQHVINILKNKIVYIPFFLFHMASLQI